MHSFKLEVEHRDPRTLTAPKRQARRHSKKQIADSMARLGVLTTVLINGAGRVIAGWARVEAAKLLGLATIPTVVADHLSEPEQRAYTLASNKIALNAGWDPALLAIEPQEIHGL